MSATVSEMPSRNAIFEAYRERIVQVARRYEIPGGDRDDAAQEALIELWRLSGPLSRKAPGDINNLGAVIVHRIKQRLGERCWRAHEAKKNRIVLDSLRMVTNDDGSQVPAVEAVVDDPYGLGQDPLDAVIARELLADLVSGRIEPPKILRASSGARDYGREAIVARHTMVAELRREGQSVPAIASSLGVSAATVFNDLEAVGMPGRLPNPNVRDDSLRCSKCREWKPDDAFPSSRSSPHRRGRHGNCRSCGTEVRREWRVRNPEKVRAADERANARRKAKRYGLADA